MIFGKPDSENVWFVESGFRRTCPLSLLCYGVLDWQFEDGRTEIIADGSSRLNDERVAAWQPAALHSGGDFHLGEGGRGRGLPLLAHCAPFCPYLQHHG